VLYDGAVISVSLLLVLFNLNFLNENATLTAQKLYAVFCVKRDYGAVVLLNSLYGLNWRFIAVTYCRAIAVAFTILCNSRSASIDHTSDGYNA